MFIEFRIIFIRIIFVRYHRVEFCYGMGLFRDLQWDGLFVDNDGHRPEDDGPCPEDDGPRLLCIRVFQLSDIGRVKWGYRLFYL